MYSCHGAGVLQWGPMLVEASSLKKRTSMWHYSTLWHVPGVTHLSVRCICIINCPPQSNSLLKQSSSHFYFYIKWEGWESRLSQEVIGCPECESSVTKGTDNLKLQLNFLRALALQPNMGNSWGVFLWGGFWVEELNGTGPEGVGWTDWDMRMRPLDVRLYIL